MRRDLYKEMFDQESYYWWHVGKRELVRALLEKYTNGEKELRILDVGCGTGMMVSELDLKGEVWGLDGDNLAINFCRKRGIKLLKKTDLLKIIPFPENTFDIVLCLDVLEHISNDKVPLAEFRRILKPGGLLIITVPAYPKLMSYWDKMAGHYRRYTTGSLNRLLAENDFIVKRVSYFNSFALLPAVFVRLIKSLLIRKGEENKGQSSDFMELPNWLNRFLLLLTKMEKSIITRVNIPVGLSLISLSQKNGKK